MPCQLEHGLEQGDLAGERDGLGEQGGGGSPLARRQVSEARFEHGARESVF